MIEKKITICIGTDDSKHFRARLSLWYVENSVWDRRGYHSINIEPGADLAYIRSANELHLADPNGGVPGAPWPKIPDAEWAEVEQHIAIVHKPEVVAAYRARIAAAKEAR